jgi:hypothetical protein
MPGENGSSTRATSLESNTGPAPFQKSSPRRPEADGRSIIQNIELTTEPISRPIPPNATRVQPLRIQVEFCLAHRKKSAEQDWAMRKYPSIAWDTLKERLLQFHPILFGILDGHAPSFYRDALMSTFNLNNRRDLRKGRLHSMGYYGPRGSEIL